MVYILIKHIPYESSDIVGVYENQKTANEHRLSMEKEHDESNDPDEVRFLIEPHTLIK